MTTQDEHAAMRTALAESVEIRTVLERPAETAPEGEEGLVERLRQVSAVIIGGYALDECGETLIEAAAELTRLQAENARLKARVGWQPIETAPKGEVVWAYGLIPGDYGYTLDRHDMAKTRLGRDGRWTFVQPMGRHDPTYWSPTHWMSLPKPPTTLNERQDDAE